MTAGTLLAQAAVVLAAIAVGVGAGWPLTAWVLARSTGPDPAGSGQPVLRGGTWIGALERPAILGSILVGYPEAMAVVIADSRSCALRREPRPRSGSSSAP